MNIKNKKDNIDRTIESYWSAIEKISDAQKNNRLAFFIGAGVSMCSGAPSWNQLMDPIKKELGIGSFCKIKDEYEKLEKELEENKIDKDLFIKEFSKFIVKNDESDYLKIAQLYYEHLKEKHNNDMKKVEQEYRKIIKENVLIDRLKPSEVHNLLMDIYPNNIITTNWDTLLEEVKEEKLRNYSVVKKNDDLSSLNDTHKIIKMHGDLDTDFVFKEDDYLSYSENFCYIENYVKNVLKSNTVVFMGYSYSDINIKLINSWFKNNGSKSTVNNQPEWYMVVVDDLSYEERAYFTNNGFKVVELNKIYKGFISKKRVYTVKEKNEEYDNSDWSIEKEYYRKYENITNDNNDFEEKSIVRTYKNITTNKKQNKEYKNKTNYDLLFLQHIKGKKRYPIVDAKDLNEVLKSLYNKIKPLDCQNVILLAQLQKFINIYQDKQQLHYVLDKNTGYILNISVYFHKLENFMECIYRKNDCYIEEKKFNEVINTVSKINDIFIKANMHINTKSKYCIKITKLNKKELYCFLNKYVFGSKNVEKSIKNENYEKIKKEYYRLRYDNQENNDICSYISDFEIGLNHKEKEIYDIIKYADENMFNNSVIISKEGILKNSINPKELENNLYRMRVQMKNIVKFIYINQIKHLERTFDIFMQEYYENYLSKCIELKKYKRTIIDIFDIINVILHLKTSILVEILNKILVQKYSIPIKKGFETYFYDCFFKYIKDCPNYRGNYIIKKYRLICNYLLVSAFIFKPEPNKGILFLLEEEIKQDKLEKEKTTEENYRHQKKTIELFFNYFSNYIKEKDRDFEENINYFVNYVQFTNSTVLALSEENSVYIIDNLIGFTFCISLALIHNIKNIIEELKFKNYNNSKLIEKLFKDLTLKENDSKRQAIIKNVITPLYKISSESLKAESKVNIEKMIDPYNKDVLFDTIMPICHFYVDNDIEIKKGENIYKFIKYYMLRDKLPRCFSEIRHPFGRSFIYENELIRVNSVNHKLLSDLKNNVIKLQNILYLYPNIIDYEGVKTNLVKDLMKIDLSNKKLVKQTIDSFIEKHKSK